MTPDQRAKYVDALLRTGLETTSAREAGVNMAKVRKEFELDESFKEECEEILEICADNLEAEARRRAVEGVAKGIYYRGDHIADETVYSDALLIKLLTARRPEVFGDKREITGAAGAPIQIVIQDFTDDFL